MDNFQEKSLFIFKRPARQLQDLCFSGGNNLPLGASSARLPNSTHQLEGLSPLKLPERLLDARKFYRI